MVSQATRATLIFNELASGDLSSNPLSPTALLVGLGSNWINASVDKLDRDYFSITLPPGASLTGIILRASVGSEATFLGLQPGAAFTEPPDAAQLHNLLGYASFFGKDVGTDLLPTIASAADAIGFRTPLEGITFTFWVEQFNPAPASYELEFVVGDASIPSPGSLAYIAAGVVCAMPRWRRRQRAPRIMNT